MPATRRVAEASPPTKLSAGKALRESIHLPANHYFEIEIEQLEGDVSVEVSDPRGRVVASSDLPGKPWLGEVVALVTDVEGIHQLRITPFSSQATRFVETGRRSRRARPQDGALLEALALRAEALRLKEGSTEEDLTAAADLLTAAAQLLTADVSPEWGGRVLRELAFCHERTGENEIAEELHRESIARLRLTAHKAQLAESLDGYGGLLLGRGERAAAHALFQEALDLARRVGDLRIEALSWNNLGGYYYYEGDMERVVEAFERSLAIGASAGRLDERANTLSNLGAVYRSLGRYSDALELSEEALALARRLGDTDQEMRVLNNRGVLRKGVGDLRSAIDDYQTALEIAERLGDIRWQANIGSNLGAIYRILGHRRRAIEYLAKALDAAIAADSVTDEIWALITIGELLREDGDPEAQDFFRRARERSEAAENRAGEAYSSYGLGRLRQDEGDAVAAAELLARALALLEELSDRPGQLSAHRELARALAELGRSERASKHFAEAVALARLVGDPFQEAAARARHARFLLDSGDPEAAQREVSVALATVESLKRGVVEPDLRAGLMSRSQRDFTLLVDILETLDRRFPRQGYAEQAFVVAERSRARSLVELLIESEADLIQDLSDDLRSRRNDLAGRLSAAQRSLTRALSQAELDAERTDELKSDVRELNRERQALEREIRLSDPRWDRLVYPEPLDVAEAQALLEPGQAFVSFVLGERGSYVFVVTSSQLAFERIASEERLRPLIEEVRAHLERPGRRAMGRYRAVAAELYLELLAPVERLLVDRSHLLISPDGLLHYLPFEALLLPAGGERAEEYLLAKWAVSYLPSATTLGVLERRESSVDVSSFDLAAFADPALPAARETTVGEGPILRGLGDRDSWQWRRLAGARSEVESIAELFDATRVKMFLGSEATERRFREETAVRDARYVHLAAHAVIDNDEPALSALLLTADTAGDDGLLQAHEIFELELDAQLVVLSGCETALGRQVRGEGLLGMTRAFLYAGADAVAVSLWAVEDASTAELMVGFYRRLSAGAGMAEALRQAKLEQIAAGVQAHPYYWAPFVLVGSP